MWKARAYQGLPNVLRDYPKYRWIFLTLTVKNCELNDLRATVLKMNDAFARMSKRKKFPGKGWIKALEVTAVYDCYDGSNYLGRHGLTFVSKWKKENKRDLRLEITDEAHPHLHVLLLVNPSYFKTGYLSQKSWIEFWKESLRVDYDPSVRVTAIKEHLDPKFIIPEVLKYQTKESDLVSDANWLRRLSEQMHKIRAINTGGVLTQYLKIEEEPDDLIGKTDEEVASEAVLYFGWKQDIKRYKLYED